MRTVGHRRSSLELIRYSDDSFDLAVTHPDYAVSLRRRGDATALALPKHGVVFLGTGDVDAADHLAPAGMVARLCSPRTTLVDRIAAVVAGRSAGRAGLLRGMLQVTQDPQTGRWTVE